jgi:hypothetical protein
MAVQHDRMARKKEVSIMQWEDAAIGLRVRSRINRDIGTIVEPDPQYPYLINVCWFDNTEHDKQGTRTSVEQAEHLEKVLVSRIGRRWEQDR